MHSYILHCHTNRTEDDKNYYDNRKEPPAVKKSCAGSTGACAPWQNKIEKQKTKTIGNVPSVVK